MSGLNKKESALRAGYKKETAETPSLIERTQRYAVLVTEILDTNTNVMRNIINSIHNDVEGKEFDDLPTNIKADIAHKLSRIHDVLTPKVTVKETTDSQGRKTRVAWGSNASQLNETLVERRDIAPDTEETP